ncbi:MAG: DUF4097 family beta strand repeat protein [Fibrella sp.]|nr:DUF4097 family beta strand repeat protein [Armatimonadota bacterium]
MAKEENLLILKMLQDGTITAEQAAELLSAVDVSAKRTEAPPAPPAPPTGAIPLPPQYADGTLPPIPPMPPEFDIDDEDDPGSVSDLPSKDSDTLSRARAKIAAARERVAGVQEQLSAAEVKLDHAEKSGEGENAPWDTVADALKDVPGARSIADALRGIDPRRIASTARRQARRIGRQVRTSLGDLTIDLSINLEAMQGEPEIAAPREATASVPAGGTLRVKNTLGNIEAIGADVPEARVAGVLKVWAADRAAAEDLASQIQLTVENGPDGPTVAVTHPARVRRASLDLKVFVPSGQPPFKISLMSPSGDVSARSIKNAAVVLATQSGDARAMEIAGDVAADTASGDIAVEGVLGSVSVGTASGDIEAVRLSGATFRASTQSGDVRLSDGTVPTVNVETVSGDLFLSHLAGRTARARTVSGDITATEVTFDGEAAFDTVSGTLEFAPKSPLKSSSIKLAAVSGDIEARLPRDTDATLDLSSKGGDVEATLYPAPASGGGVSGVTEKVIRASGMVSVAETLGAGTSPARIVVGTVSGDITVTQAKE